MLLSIPIRNKVQEDKLFKVCSLCARLNDLSDYELCSMCCCALAEAQSPPELPDSLDNSIAWLCQKLGTGTLPVLLVMFEELTLTHFMHHYVFLPTPIGSELVHASVKAVAKVRSIIDKISSASPKVFTKCLKVACKLNSMQPTHKT